MNSTAYAHANVHIHTHTTFLDTYAFEITALALCLAFLLFHYVQRNKENRK